MSFEKFEDSMLIISRKGIKSCRDYCGGSPNYAPPRTSSRGTARAPHPPTKNHFDINSPVSPHENSDPHLQNTCG